ncbi:betaine aldehyde dehydrogenase [Pseudoneurospora amorphoporcata]|uniref:aldehyde dehydrogenase (NAD(+)) n=1 Tax=Pseudoneurospora amorphoporcata TaxID=241081 RepID=A0AAN6SF76_9PEZI|nr:betaine aldehyde dehydrogenase [Pseudoneurospora amorphoporcata]
MTTEHLLWIGGAERTGNGELIPVENPATGEIIAHCHPASQEDVVSAVELAHATYKSGIWSRAPRHVRAEVLERAASLFETHIAVLIEIEVEQTGRAIREMNAQVPSLVKWFRYYAALLRTEERSVLPTVGNLHNFLDRRPLGVVVQITPFNHPLLIAVKKLAPALTAGNSIMKEAGLPDGVLSVLPGYGATTGKALVEHPLVKKVDVTGGTTAGRAIGEIVGRNLAKYTAELGGKAPLVVFKDADLDAAVNGIAFGAFIASGQTCVAATRIIVHESIYDKVLQRLTTRANSIERRMGSPKNPECMMGPLISERQLKNVAELVDEASLYHELILQAGGNRLEGHSELDDTNFSKGYYLPPTILAKSNATDRSMLSTRIWREEAFGPVVVVVGFRTEDEAVELANDSEFGLGAAIWTRDLAQAFRVSEQIDAGIVWVNTHHRNDPSSPWGGAKSSSGVGSENGIDAYHAYTITKSTIINYASAEEMAAEDWFKEGAGNVRYGRKLSASTSNSFPTTFITFLRMPISHDLISPGQLF